MRIGLSGTNWTGKTSTIQQLVATRHGIGAQVIAINKYVNACPFPIGSKQTLEATQWIVDQVRDTLDELPNDCLQIFDRTPLDILAFTLYAGQRAKETPAADSRLIDLASQIHRLGSKIDAVFLCGRHPLWPLPAKPTDESLEFARTMSSFLALALDEWNHPTIQLPDEIGQRLMVIDRWLSEPYYDARI